MTESGPERFPLYTKGRWFLWYTRILSAGLDLRHQCYLQGYGSAGLDYRQNSDSAASH